MLLVDMSGGDAAGEELWHDPQAIEAQYSITARSIEQRHTTGLAREDYSHVSDEDIARAVCSLSRDVGRIEESVELLTGTVQWLTTVVQSDITTGINAQMQVGSMPNKKTTGSSSKTTNDRKSSDKTINKKGSKTSDTSDDDTSSEDDEDSSSDSNSSTSSEEDDRRKNGPKHKQKSKKNSRHQWCHKKDDRKKNGRTNPSNDRKHVVHVKVTPAVDTRNRGRTGTHHYSTARELSSSSEARQSDRLVEQLCFNEMEEMTKVCVKYLRHSVRGDWVSFSHLCRLKPVMSRYSLAQVRSAFESSVNRNGRPRFEVSSDGKAVRIHPETEEWR